MNPLSAELLAVLTKAPEPLRSGAFHRLLHDVWRVVPDDAGRGVPTPIAAEWVPALCATLQKGGTPEPDRIAFLLGLLAEAEREGRPPVVGMGPLRAAMLGTVQMVLDAMRADADGSTEQGTPTPSREGLLYLLGQFPEERERIMDTLSRVLGADAPATQALHGIFALAASQPRRARSILAYLGAEAAHQAGPDREALLRQTLACPVCAQPLEFSSTVIRCGGCSGAYGWQGDVPSLLRPEDARVDEFPAARVAEYEHGTRPRFVRVMTGDFERLIDRDFEARYLQQQLRPVEGMVVDLACGAGGWTRMVADLVGADRVLALDYSVAMLSAVGARVPRALRVHASASALPVQSGVLGAINCSDALQALPDPTQALAEAARCLRPGAPLTCFTMLEGAPPYGYFQARFPDFPRTRFTTEGLMQTLTAVGLECVDWVRVGYGVFFTARRPVS